MALTLIAPAARARQVVYAETRRVFGYAWSRSFFSATPPLQDASHIHATATSSGHGHIGGGVGADAAGKAGSWPTPPPAPAPAPATSDGGISDDSEPVYGTCRKGTKVFRHEGTFVPEYGGRIRNMEIAYETWGKLNKDHSNVVLLHTGLTGSSHAKSSGLNPLPGWWENFIGPGGAVDTDKFFVICTNVLGGCFGSTGPASINPDTKQRYATTFPVITIFDMIRAQLLLLDHLGVDRLHGSVGASMGGMQSIALAAIAPERVGRVVSISAAARSHPFAIALRYSQRRVLMGDPKWNGGNYYDGPFPEVGMSLAREIATISYRSGPEWMQRFSNRRSTSLPTISEPDFLIEQYLNHQGAKFLDTGYDPNSFVYISKAMDLFDMSDQMMDTSPQERLLQGLKRVKSPTLVLGVQSDSLFPVFLQKEMAEYLKKAGSCEVTYYELDALFGHDTFLLDPAVGSAVKGHLEMSNT